LHTPYAVDNARFQQAAATIDKTTLRSSFGIPDTAFLILYSGKYIAKKRPMDVLKAFATMHAENSYLIMMGDGALRSDMEQYIIEHQLQQKVLLTGFINQKEVSNYYALADAFVMCSDYGETWGLSVNEAMNFSLPLVVSDRCGCAMDLVEQGINGYVFETGNIHQLANNLQQLQQLPSDKRKQMGEASLQKINTYSYRVIHERLLPLHA
jgi:glycosyltransferase involved in cell wall biosynthesis